MVQSDFRDRSMDILKQSNAIQIQKKVFSKIGKKSRHLGKVKYFAKKEEWKTFNLDAVNPWHYSNNTLYYPQNILIPQTTRARQFKQNPAKELDQEVSDHLGFYDEVKFRKALERIHSPKAIKAKENKLKPPKNSCFVPFGHIIKDNKDILIPFANNHFTKYQRLCNKLKHNQIQKEQYELNMQDIRNKRVQELKKVRNITNIFERERIVNKPIQRATSLPKIKKKPNYEKIREAEQQMLEQANELQHSVLLSGFSTMVDHKDMYFYWHAQKTLQHQQYPQAREGATLTSFEHSLFVYGGRNGRYLKQMIKYSQSKPFKYYFNNYLGRRKWYFLKSDSEPKNGRTQHTACLYKQKGQIVIFGGESFYSPFFQLRKCTNNIYFYTISKLINTSHNFLEKNIWSKYEKPKRSVNLISPRRAHESIIMGNQMLVCGGIDNTGNFMKDVWSYDLALKVNKLWQNYESEIKDVDIFDGFAFHKGAAVYKHQPYFLEQEGLYKIQKRKTHKSKKTNFTSVLNNSQPMDDIEAQQIIDHEGVYFFGGVTPQGKVLNNVYILELGANSLRFSRKHKIYVIFIVNFTEKV